MIYINTPYNLQKCGTDLVLTLWQGNTVTISILWLFLLINYTNHVLEFLTTTYQRSCLLLWKNHQPTLGLKKLWTQRQLYILYSTRRAVIAYERGTALTFSTIRFNNFAPLQHTICSRRSNSVTGSRKLPLQESCAPLRNLPAAPITTPRGVMWLVSLTSSFY